MHPTIFGDWMDRYVVSAQRSGLNWLRFCIEAFYGTRTPGQASLLTRDEAPAAVFVRSHDALNLRTRARKKAKGSWTPLDPKAVAGDKVLLLLRDPLETFVRMAGRRYPRFLSYVSNIRFYDQAKGADRCVAYYEDLVGDPATMVRVMEFLEITPAEGYTAPSVNEATARWAELSERSRQNYDAKQSGSGGSHTKGRPTDFSFHRRGLSAEESEMVWRYLQLRLSPAQLLLLDRYFPDPSPPRPGALDRLRFFRA